MVVERRLFLLVILLLSMNNYANAGKDKEYIQEISTGKDSEIVGDGNCFYRCISVYFFGHQNEHSKIRQNINRYMLGDGCMSEAENEERSRRYRRFMLNTPQSYEDYLRLHSNNGVWADEPIIQAAADLYGFNIYVTSYGNSGVSQLVRATSLQLPHDSSRLLHLRLENSHYTCIEHDCQTDSVPSGDFVEMQNVIDFGNQNRAEPYEDSLNVLEYSKTVGLPKTVKDDESNDVGMDPFNNEDDVDYLNSSRSNILPETVGSEESREKNDENFDGFENLAKKKTINTVTQVQERELENQKDEDLENKFCLIDTEEEEPIDLEDPPKDNEDHQLLPEYADVTELLNESISESCPINTSVEDKTPKQEFIRCRDREHLTELWQNGQVAFGTVCRVRRSLFCNYSHYFMFLDIWPLADSFDIVHLAKTYSLKIICKIINVSCANGSNSLFDFQNGLEIECLNSPVSNNQKKEMVRRLFEVLSCPYLNYSLTSEDGFYCESLISYIKTGDKTFFEVTGFREHYPVKGPIIIHSVNLFAYLTSLGINAFRVLKNNEYDVINANNEFEIILWLLSRVSFAIVNSHIENNDNYLYHYYYQNYIENNDNDDNNNNSFNNNNNNGDKTDI